MSRPTKLSTATKPATANTAVVERANAQSAKSAKPTSSHIAKLAMKPGTTKSIKPIELGIKIK